MSTTKHPLKVMFFGAISHIAKSKLVAIKGTVTAETYQATLQQADIQRFIQEHPEEDPELMKDGAPGHRVKSTKEWHQCHGIRLFPGWPLYESMPRRMAAVIAAGGRHTKY